MCGENFMTEGETQASEDDAGVCRICDERFDTLDDLGTHLSGGHPDGDPSEALAI
jgi:hypothetical protein